MLWMAFIVMAHYVARWLHTIGSPFLTKKKKKKHPGRSASVNETSEAALLMEQYKSHWLWVIPHRWILSSSTLFFSSFFCWCGSEKSQIHSSNGWESGLSSALSQLSAGLPDSRHRADSSPAPTWFFILLFVGAMHQWSFIALPRTERIYLPDWMLPPPPKKGNAILNDLLSCFHERQAAVLCINSVVNSQFFGKFSPTPLMFV